MFIVGAGAAYPNELLSDELLASLGLNPNEAERRILDRFGVRSRRTSLPLDYIKNTRNVEILEARAVATATPTSLGIEAARQAMERAGIAPEQLGLIIADTATPYQTCPSEAQRIGGGLGLKVPAFDVIGGIGALSLHIEMLSSWKPERVPDYVLCVSTNTPTQQVDFSGPVLPAYLFGDAAAAFVISTRHQGKLQAQNFYLGRDGRFKSAITVQRSISLACEHMISYGELGEIVAQGFKKLSVSVDMPSRAPYLVAPQLFGGDMRRCGAKFTIPSERLLSATLQGGYALGASAGVAVTSLWDTLQAGEQIVVLHGGDGLLSGGILSVSF